MERREFIKISTLFAGFLATRNINNWVPSPEGEILIYKIRNYEHGIQVCATKYLNLKDDYSGFGTKGKIDIRKFDVSTFEPIEVTTLKDANDRKKHWWNELRCKGRWVEYQGIKHSTTGKMGSSKLKAQNYYLSEEFKQHKKKWLKLLD